MEKFMKTPAIKRQTYTYYDENGKVLITLVSGENGVTAEDIHQLHLLDDAEVRNNLKNAKPKVSKRQKEEIEKWKQENPDKKAPQNWTLSFEQFALADESKSRVLAKVAGLPIYEEAPEIARLHELIETLEPQQQALIQAVYFERKPLKEIAAEEKVSHEAIRRRLLRIYMQIKKKF